MNEEKVVELMFLTVDNLKTSYIKKQNASHQKMLIQAKKRVHDIKELMVKKHNFTFESTYTYLKFSHNGKQRFVININSTKHSVDLFKKYYCIIEFSRTPLKFEKKHKMYGFFQNCGNTNDWLDSYSIISYRNLRKLIDDYVYFMKEEENGSFL
jgi:hypothetical protein